MPHPFGSHVESHPRAYSAVHRRSHSTPGATYGSWDDLRLPPLTITSLMTEESPQLPFYSIDTKAMPLEGKTDAQTISDHITKEEDAGRGVSPRKQVN